MITERCDSPPIQLPKMINYKLKKKEEVHFNSELPSKKEIFKGLAAQSIEMVIKIKLNINGKINGKRASVCLLLKRTRLHTS